MAKEEVAIQKKTNKSAIALVAVNILLFLFMVVLLFSSSKKDPDEIAKENLVFSQQNISELPTDLELHMDCEMNNCEKFTKNTDLIEESGKNSYVYLKQHSPVEKTFIFYTENYILEDSYCNVVGMDHIDLKGFSDDSIKCRFIFRND